MTHARRQPRVRSLRTRVRDAIALVAAVSLLLFGIPLAVVLDRLIGSTAVAGLQRDATRAVASVPDNALEQGSSVRLPRSTGDTVLGVYDAQGARVAGVGPTRSVLAAQVADGREHDGQDHGDLTVVIPVLSDTTVAGSIRAAVPLAVLRARVYRTWGSLAALALGIISVAVLLARRAARGISMPFEHITTAARALGEGRYDVHLPRWGIPEADAAGDALQEAARHIDALIAHERQFMSDASHQIRTPLAGVLLSLGRQPPDVTSAVACAHHLQTTIDDLQSLRGLAGKGSCDPQAVAADAVQRWTRPGRPVTLRSDHADPVAIPGPALRQSLDVLIDNALRHGAGPVTVTVEPYGGSVLVEVADHGVGFAADAAPGTGLQLATRIVERAGGSLLVRRRSPQARVALVLPLSTLAPHPQREDVGGAPVAGETVGLELGPAPS